MGKWWERVQKRERKKNNNNNKEVNHSEPKQRKKKEKKRRKGFEKSDMSLIAFCHFMETHMEEKQNS